MDPKCSYKGEIKRSIAQIERWHCDYRKGKKTDVVPGQGRVATACRNTAWSPFDFGSVTDSGLLASRLVRKFFVL